MASHKQTVSGWAPVSCKNSMPLAASHFNNVPKWQPVVCNLYPCGLQLEQNFCEFYSFCIQLVATPAPLACGWWPFRYNLNVTGHAIFACTSGQFSAEMPVFESTQTEQLFELKMRKPLKNLRAYTKHVLARTYPSTLCTA